MLNALTVSIHAPVKGRRDGRYVGKNVVSFNPRPREGATRRTRSITPSFAVSIHAPVKGRPWH